jgi:hypothetical protein
MDYLCVQTAGEYRRPFPGAIRVRSTYMGSGDLFRQIAATLQVAGAAVYNRGVASMMNSWKFLRTAN